MKKLFLIVASCIFMLNINAQNEISFPIDSVTNKISYTEIVYLDNINKDILYLRSKEWFAKTFNSSNDVLQMQDKEDGVLIGKAQINVQPLSSLDQYSRFIFTISMYFKDGRYKYEITDFIYYFSGDGNVGHSAEYVLNATKNDYPRLTRQGYISVFNQLKKNMDFIINNLKISMEKQTNNEKGW